jgi:D-alanyl-D-alanine carboxypeptidase (penicillin-binding protein 5/6)
MTCRLSLTALLLLLVAASGWGQPPAAPPAKLPADRIAGPPVVTARAWAVADGKTGKLLWGSREDQPLTMASTTKIMTARVVLRLAADAPEVLDERVAVSERAARVGGSSAGVRAGEKFVVRDLLYGLLLPSGNDAAVALAEHFGPRLPAADPDEDGLARFVAEMNRQAKALKMAETRYFDPHGNSKNRASARDLAALAGDVLQDARFRAYAATTRHECVAATPGGEKRAVRWENTNRLLTIEGYDGVKTGTTGTAGYCLVASGRNGPDWLIVVVLGCTSNDSRYADARNLFRWAWRERGHGPEEAAGGGK